MPLYEYICPKCKNEEVIRMTFAEYSDLQEAAKEKGGSGVYCNNTEECGLMRRHFSPPGIQIN